MKSPLQTRVLAAATMIALLLVASIASVACAAEDFLAQGFAAPPASARPWVYWFPLDGNITREGITADLEAMRRVGIGGVLYMETAGHPAGAGAFGSPAWRELFQHACTEAARLGLEINMNNDAGWCGSGGPWITPELSMQKVVWSETAVAGPRHFDAALPQPKAVAGFLSRHRRAGFPHARARGDFRITASSGKAAFTVGPGSARCRRPCPPCPPERSSRGRIVDLTAQIDARRPAGLGRAGRQVDRLALRPHDHGQGQPSRARAGRGLECDKLSKAGGRGAFR